MDRDVNVGPVGRNWLRRWFQMLNLSFTFTFTWGLCTLTWCGGWWCLKSGWWMWVRPLKQWLHILWEGWLLCRQPFFCSWKGCHLDWISYSVTVSSACTTLYWLVSVLSWNISHKLSNLWGRAYSDHVISVEKIEHGRPGKAHGTQRQEGVDNTWRRGERKDGQGGLRERLPVHEVK